MNTIAVSDSKQSRNSVNTKAPVVINIKSNLCYENAHEIVEDVRGMILKHPKRIVLDFSAVEIMDSSGLRALLESRKLCDKAGVELKLASLSKCILRIINMSRFGKILDIPQIDMNNHQTQQLDKFDYEAQGWNVAEYVAASDPSIIAILRSKVRDAALKAGVRDELLCDIQIAAGEALTNAYKHGSPNRGTDKITLRCMSCSKVLVVEVEDEGTPFDPERVAEPDPNQMRENGMGLFIMRQAMDAVEFKSDCPGNKVRMIKWLDAKEELVEDKMQNQTCQLTLLT